MPSDPGNTLVTATSLNVNATPRIVPETLSTTDSDDYYRFRLEGRSSFNLSLTGLDGNADLQLLDVNGTLIQQSVNGGSLAESVNVADLGAGIYYVRVFLGDGSSNASYNLSLQSKSNLQTDLTWRNSSTGQNVIWDMNGTSFVTSTQIKTISDTNWRIVDTQDFNGDGKPDLLLHNYATQGSDYGKNVIWLMNGTSLITGIELPVVHDPNWNIAGVSDFNWDGQLDILWRNTATQGDAAGKNIVWLLNGVSVVPFSKG